MMLYWVGVAGKVVADALGHSDLAFAYSAASCLPEWRTSVF